MRPYLDLETIELVAMYLVDRSQQYAPHDIGMLDAAKNLMNGEFEESVSHGELDDRKLKLRVRRWSK